MACGLIGTVSQTTTSWSTEVLMRSSAGSDKIAWEHNQRVEHDRDNRMQRRQHRTKHRRRGARHGNRAKPLSTPTRNKHRRHRNQKHIAERETKEKDKELEPLGCRDRTDNQRGANREQPTHHGIEQIAPKVDTKAAKRRLEVRANRMQRAPRWPKRARILNNRCCLDLNGIVELGKITRTRTAKQAHD